MLAKGYYNFVYLLFVFLIFVFLSGCGDPLDVSANANSEHHALSTTMSAVDAWQLLRDGKLIVVDVRTPAEWRSTGTPKGAIRLSFQAHPQGIDGFVNDLEKALDGDRASPFAIICRTGNRTQKLAEYLREEGFSRVIDISEGMAGSRHGRGWIRNDLPLE